MNVAASRAVRQTVKATRAGTYSRAAIPRHARVRYQSTSSSPNTSSSAANASSGLAAGVAGGLAVLAAGYGWYHFSGTKSVVDTAHKTKLKFQQAFESTTQSAPKPNEAIQWLRETVTSYTKIIPGAQSYVDTAFEDLETINKKHGPEVEKIIKDTYDELKGVAKAGATYESLIQVWPVLQKALSRIGDLAKDASQDVLKNHPELKEKVGSRFEQLKSMGDNYGPEAKKQVEETWSQVEDVLKSGPLSSDGIKKIQNLIQEKTEQVQKYGNEAWQKGLDEAKPLLEKNPKIKEFVEKNKEQLVKGDLGKLWQKLSELIKKGDTDEALKYAKEQVENAGSKASKSSAGASAGVSHLFGQIPGAEELGEKFSQLQELYKKRGKEAEDLVKSAVDDIKNVLAQKVKEGEKLKEKAEKDVKN